MHRTQWGNAEQAKAECLGRSNSTRENLGKAHRIPHLENPIESNDDMLRVFIFASSPQCPVLSDRDCLFDREAS